MAKRTILVDSARRELEKHGTETFLYYLFTAHSLSLLIK